MNSNIKMKVPGSTNKWKMPLIFFVIIIVISMLGYVFLLPNLSAQNNVANTVSVTPLPLEGDAFNTPTNPQALGDNTKDNSERLSTMFGSNTGSLQQTSQAPEVEKPLVVSEPLSPVESVKINTAEEISSYSEASEQTVAMSEYELTKLKTEVSVLRSQVKTLMARVMEMPNNTMENPSIHRVKPGETLMGIAAKYNLATGCLVAWNDVNNAHKLVVGALLKLTGNVKCVDQSVWGYKKSQTKRLALNNWLIMGMDENSVALVNAHNRESMNFYKLGDYVPGAGEVTKINLAGREVLTSKGIINKVVSNDGRN